MKWVYIITTNKKHMSWGEIKMFLWCDPLSTCTKVLYLFCLFFTFIGNMTHSSSDVAIFVVSFLQTRSIKNDLLQLCSMSSKHFWKYDLILGLSNISKLRTSYDCNLNIIQIYLFSSCVGGWSLREKHPNIYVTNERNRANLRLLTKRCNCNVF